MDVLTIDKLTVGDLVTYIPNHADGDPNHEDCEQGHISTIREDVTKYVWVRFNSSSVGQRCNIENLTK